MTTRIKSNHETLGIYFLDTLDPSKFYPNWVDGVQNLLPFELGTRVREFNNSGELVFVKAGAALAEGDVCYIDDAWNVVPITTANGANKIGFKIGIALGTVTNGYYCWVQVNGLCDSKALASMAVGARLNTTATAGTLDDDGTAGSRQILGIANLVVVGGAPALTKTMLTDPTVGPTL